MFRQPEFAHLSANISSLIAEPGLWRNYPEYQREYRWLLPYRQCLIDSILRGYPVPPLLCFKFTDETGAMRYRIIDGKQRLETIYTFLAGAFRTSGRAFNGVKPVEPRSHYHELSPAAQSALKTYAITFQVWVNYTPDDHDDIFRRIARNAPLSRAEVVMTYPTEPNARAESIAQHPFWEAHMRPTDLDKSTDHYYSLAMLMLHRADRHVHIDSHGIENFARGVSADRFDLALAERRARGSLDAMMHVFQGTEGHINIIDVIILAQAVQKLQDLGVDARSLRPSALVGWLAMIRERANRENPFQVNDRTVKPWARLHTVINQAVFWERYTTSLLEIARVGVAV